MAGVTVKQEVVDHGYTDTSMSIQSVCNPITDVNNTVTDTSWIKSEKDTNWEKTNDGTDTMQFNDQIQNIIKQESDSSIQDKICKIENVVGHVEIVPITVKKEPITDPCDEEPVQTVKYWAVSSTSHQTVQQKFTEAITASLVNGTSNNQSDNNLQIAGIFKHSEPTENQPFQCKTCLKCFTRRTGLNKHMRIHTGEMRYQCEICDKRFARRSGYTQHMNTHTKEKKYQCDICFKFYTQSSSLHEHKLFHTGVKKYGCEDCGKRFFQRSGLTNHRRLHTGEKKFECETCGKFFAQRHNMTEHQRIHTGEKPFECEFCGKTFTHRVTYKQHKRLHTGEKPHECKECGMGFASSSGLSQHKNSHHKATVKLNFKSDKS